MPDTLALTDSNVRRPDALLQAPCSLAGGGKDAGWVRVNGELDVATTPRRARTLRGAQARARLVVFDLRDLAFGVHALVAAAARARNGGGPAGLLRGRLGINRVFKLTELG